MIDGLLLQSRVTNSRSQGVLTEVKSTVTVHHLTVDMKTDCHISSKGTEVEPNLNDLVECREFFCEMGT